MDFKKVYKKPKKETVIKIDRDKDTIKITQHHPCPVCKTWYCSCKYNY